MGYVTFEQFGQMHTAPVTVDVTALSINYTGDYTDQLDVVMSGKTYRLLTLTGSGTLTIDKSVKADVWLCSGGNGGRSGAYNGGAGGYFTQADNTKLDVSTVCVIGAGGGNAAFGGTSSFGTITTQEGDGSYVAHGASGGGQGGRDASSNVVGTGCGVSTIPFLDDSTTFSDPHCAGGGGGGYRNVADAVYGIGGAGGSDGADGGASQVGTSSSYAPGDGGVKGGGAGGKGASATSGNGGDATFYGSGGGAGGYYKNSGGTGYTKTPGSGYQGIIYVRIPYRQ